MVDSVLTDVYTNTCTHKHMYVSFQFNQLSWKTISISLQVKHGVIPRLGQFQNGVRSRVFLFHYISSSAGKYSNTCPPIALSFLYRTCCKVCNLLQYYFLDTVSYISHLIHLWKIIQKVKDLRDMASVILTNGDEQHSINHVCGPDEMFSGESKHNISGGKFCETPNFTP